MAGGADPADVLVDLVNGGDEKMSFSMSITLHVGGTIVTGQLSNGAAFIEHTRDAFIDGWVRGLKAIMEKGKKWSDTHEIHKAEVEGPWPNGNRFIVKFSYDVTNKPSGKRIQMEEGALLTVENDKIVREEFFYSTEG